jgi:hypothetical protein
MIALTLARKPLVGTVVASCLVGGPGALNIDGCRIASGTDHFRAPGVRRNTLAGDTRGGAALGMFAPALATKHPGGRWPANLVISHEPGCHVEEGLDRPVRACAEGCSTKALDADSGPVGSNSHQRGVHNGGAVFGGWGGKVGVGHDTRASGGASRCFKQFGGSSE